MGCEGLTGELVIPRTVRFIGLLAFGNTNFSKIHVPKDKVGLWDEEWNDRCPAEIIYY